MSIDYASLADTARRLVGNAGKDIVVRRLGSSPGDASKPWRGAADPVTSASSKTLKGVSVPPASLIDLGARSTATDDLMQRASMVFIAAPPEDDEDLDLLGYDEVVDDRGTYRIVELDTLRPAELTLLYFIWVKA